MSDLDLKIKGLMRLTRNTMFIKPELDLKYIKEHLDHLARKGFDPESLIAKARLRIIEMPNYAVIQALDHAAEQIDEPITIRRRKR